MRNLIRRPFTGAMLATTLTLAAVGTAGPAAAAPATPDTPRPPAPTVAAVTDRLAYALAGRLADPAVRPVLRRLAAPSPAGLDPAALDPAGRLTATIAAANRDLLRAKGLPAGTPALLRVRLAHPSMAAALRAGALPVIAAVPDDDHGAATVTGYGPGGTAVSLSTGRIPARPVLLVDIDADTAVRAGLEVLRTQARQHGLQGAAPAVTAAAGGYWATKITRIRLNDDMESWVKGDAEIFALVSGFGLDGHVRVDTVDMPYLNNDGTDYRPNQLLVHWNSYRYNAADVVLMEDDGDTNYSALAAAIVTALLTILDQGQYIPLVTPVLNAIPTSWWTDDPDYVDSWYTLTTGSTGTLNGAAANGTMVVEPFFVSEL